MAIGGFRIVQFMCSANVGFLSAVTPRYYILNSVIVSSLLIRAVLVLVGVFYVETDQFCLLCVFLSFTFRDIVCYFSQVFVDFFVCQLCNFRACHYGCILCKQCQFSIVILRYGRYVGIVVLYVTLCGMPVLVDYSSESSLFIFIAFSLFLRQLLVSFTVHTGMLYFVSLTNIQESQTMPNAFSKSSVNSDVGWFILKFLLAIYQHQQIVILNCFQS